jgi:hypothetical protein
MDRMRPYRSISAEHYLEGFDAPEEEETLFGVSIREEALNFVLSDQVRDEFVAYLERYNPALAKAAEVAHGWYADSPSA